MGAPQFLIHRFIMYYLSRFDDEESADSRVNSRSILEVYTLEYISTSSCSPTHKTLQERLSPFAAAWQVYYNLINLHIQSASSPDNDLLNMLMLHTRISASSPQVSNLSFPTTLPTPPEMNLQSFHSSEALNLPPLDHHLFHQITCTIFSRQKQPLNPKVPTQTSKQE